MRLSDQKQILIINYWKLHKMIWVTDKNERKSISVKEELKRRREKMEIDR